jgi:ketosteroid isomerase-like protein
MTPAETKREMVRRMRAKDVDAAMELITDDAVYFWSNGSAMFGKAAIAEAMKSNFAGIDDDTYDVHDVTWLAESDEVAACVFRFEWTGRMDGETVGGRGRGASVLKRVGGEWRIVHENLSQGDWKDAAGEA